MSGFVVRRVLQPPCPTVEKLRQRSKELYTARKEKLDAEDLAKYNTFTETWKRKMQAIQQGREKQHYRSLQQVCIQMNLLICVTHYTFSVMTKREMESLPFTLQLTEQVQAFFHTNFQDFHTVSVWDFGRRTKRLHFSSGLWCFVSVCVCVFMAGCRVCAYFFSIW